MGHWSGRARLAGAVRVVARALVSVLVLAGIATACIDVDDDGEMDERGSSGPGDGPGFAVEGNDRELVLFLNDVDLGSDRPGAVVQFHPQARAAVVEFTLAAGDGDGDDRGRDDRPALEVCNVTVGSPPHERTGEPCATVAPATAHALTLSDATGDHVAVELTSARGSLRIEQLTIVYSPVDRYVEVRFP